MIEHESEIMIYSFFILQCTMQWCFKFSKVKFLRFSVKMFPYVENDRSTSADVNGQYWYNVNSNGERFLTNSSVGCLLWFKTLSMSRIVLNPVFRFSTFSIFRPKSLRVKEFNELRTDVTIPTLSFNDNPCDSSSTVAVTNCVKWLSMYAKSAFMLWMANISFAVRIASDSSLSNESMTAFTFGKLSA